MENEIFYQKNLETGKLNIHTSKPFYDALDNEKKIVFKRYCLWSNKQQCWVSKGKAENCWYLKRTLDELGFTLKEATGEKLSFQEQVEREQNRAEVRAERAEQRSEKAKIQSDELFGRAKDMASVIPFGQPILIGHHSESRDRKYRGRISNTFQKAFDESDKANYYAEKAETAKYTAEGKKYSNPSYLKNRIKETKATIRRLERALLGKSYVNSQAREISDQSKAIINQRLSEENEKMQFYQNCILKIDPEWSIKEQSKTSTKSKKTL